MTEILVTLTLSAGQTAIFSEVDYPNARAMLAPLIELAQRLSKEMATTVKIETDDGRVLDVFNDA